MERRAGREGWKRKEGEAMHPHTLFEDYTICTFGMSSAGIDCVARSCATAAKEVATTAPAINATGWAHCNKID